MDKCIRHTNASFYKGKCIMCRNGVPPDWIYKIKIAPQDEHGWISVDDIIPSDFNIELDTLFLFYSGRYRKGTIGYFVPNRDGCKWTNEEGYGIKGVTHWQLFNPPEC